MAAGGDPAVAPAYSVADAARLVGVPHSTAGAWVHGRGYRAGGRSKQSAPVIELDDPDGTYLSFRNLVEMHVLAAIRRQYRVSLQNTRKAVEFMRRGLHTGHPLANQRMLTDGKDLLVRHGQDLLNVSRGGQVEMDIVQSFLDRIEFGRDGALLRLFPFTTTEIARDPRDVVIDPRVQFGRPCLWRTGIPTEVIADRFLAGESIESIAADYEVEPLRVEAAIRYERLPRAA